ncbi:uncharacterized protein LOC115629061 [Scaptodrosophila lebanonensis]|uniref:Uncharacterized protein LOC115629061 n=1 Tax=Drosophila lebanonensis TaxID=7225 RepID=A0A6J2U270_DROLE|nr:uncharacterized protein LOC115629061 [Scaptodrosophila lebanonensis]
MLLMKTYMYCCSVRLGVLFIAGMSMLLSITFMAVVFTAGTSIMFEVVVALQNNKYYMDNEVIRRSTCYAKENPDMVLWVTQLLNIAYNLSCISAAYGAYKLKMWHVVPFIISEISAFVYCTIALAIFLNINQHFVGLGTLILLSLIGSSYLVFIIYNILTLMAFVQILVLVHSDRYKQYYGSDPLKPNLNNARLFDKTSPKWWHISETKSCQDDSDMKGGEEDLSEYFQRQELINKQLWYIASTKDCHFTT